MDVGFLVNRSSRLYGESVAVQCDSRRRTYAELDDRAARLAAGLRTLGLQRGERVAILLSNRIEYPEIDLSLIYAGLVRVALNVRLAANDLAYILEDAGVRAIISEPDYDETVLELIESIDGLLSIRLGARDATEINALDLERLITENAPTSLESNPPDSIAWISYTSGTTGVPKGVMLSHAALLQVSYNIMLGLGPIDEDASILLPQPLSHGGGYFVFPYLIGGGTVHIAPRFDPERVLFEGRMESIRTLKVVPTMLRDLLDCPLDSSFDTIIYGASPIDLALLQNVRERYRCSLVQNYGLSELPMTITRLSRADHAVSGSHLESAGRPWPTVQTVVLDEGGHPLPAGQVGELWATGPHVMSGYLNRPELTSEVLRDGWIRTRDMAFVDDRGYVFLRGRQDDMIISGGFNIAPKEIESVYSGHPKISECVAVGVPDDRWGQAVRLYLALRNGEVGSEDEFLEFGREPLGFRRPRSVVILEKVPKTPYGKIDRARLVKPGEP